MAWITENRRTAIVEKPSSPYLTEALKAELRDKYFPRYPTRRAVLLPALHLVQHAYNWLPTAALEEIAAFLEISPAEVMDTVTFYDEYWLKPKGKYLVGVCRSLACEVCDGNKITEHLKQKFNVDVGDTSADGKFTLIEMECIGSCGTAPAALVNEVLHENLTVEKIDALVNALPENPHDYKDPSINWEEEHGHETH